jgi:uncharacterized protein (TIGR00251 family)
LIPIHKSGGGVAFAVRIHPRARRNAITGELDHVLRVSLTAPPIDGKANTACIEFFAKLLKLPRSSVTIAFSETSRQKNNSCSRALGSRVETQGGTSNDRFVKKARWQLG